jgi:hypothetical protein
MMSATMLPMSHPVGVYADTGVASHDRFPGPNAPAGGCSPLKHPRLFGFNGTAWKDTAQKNPPFSGFSWFHDTSLDGMKQANGAGNRNRTYDLRITNAPLYQLSYSGGAA